jgi:hypothetical protein
MNLSIKEKIKQVQRNLSTRPDGDPGPHTWDCFYRATTPKELVKTPYSLRAFGNWIHIAKPEDIVPFDPQGKGLVSFDNVVSGSYSTGHMPISILVSEGKTIRDYSCHCWEKRNGETHFPESVLWYNKDGSHGISQVTKDVHLPDRENIIWAIGGAGMSGPFVKDWGNRTIPQDAVKEYFNERFGDVWRRTSHIIITIDRFGYFIAVEVGNLDFLGMVKLLNKLGLPRENCIKLDGGHVTASNTDDRKRNIYTGQHYAIKLGG